MNLHVLSRTWSRLAIVAALALLALQFSPGVWSAEPQPIGPSFDPVAIAADPAAGEDHSQTTAEQTKAALAAPWWQEALLAAGAGLMALVAAVAEAKGGWVGRAIVGVAKLVSPKTRAVLADGDRAIGQANAGMVALASTDFGQRLLRRAEQIIGEGKTVAEAASLLSGGEAQTLTELFRYGLVRYQRGVGGQRPVKDLLAIARDELPDVEV